MSASCSNEATATEWLCVFPDDAALLLMPLFLSASLILPFGSLFLCSCSSFRSDLLSRLSDARRSNVKVCSKWQWLLHFKQTGPAIEGEVVGVELLSVLCFTEKEKKNSEAAAPLAKDVRDRKKTQRHVEPETAIRRRDRVMQQSFPSFPCPPKRREGTEG